MKKLENGKKIVVNLGKKFGNARVIALYEGTHDQNDNTAVVKPVEVLGKSNWVLNLTLNTLMIIDNKQIVCEW